MSVKPRANVSTAWAVIAPVAAQFNEIVGGGKSKEEASVVSQHTPEFERIHARRYRQDDRKRPVGVRHEAIGVGDYPFAGGESTRGGFNGGHGDIDAMRAEFGLPVERAEIKTVPAAGVKNDIFGRRERKIGDGMKERAGHAAIVKATPSGYSGGRVARPAGPAVLGLEQVDVSAASDVEGVSVFTKEATLFALQDRAAIADGAKEHSNAVRQI